MCGDPSIETPRVRDWFYLSSMSRTRGVSLEGSPHICYAHGKSMNDSGIELRPKQDAMSPEQRRSVMQNLGFGRVFTEHMVTLRYGAESGWDDGVLEPYAPLTLDPASSVLHYGQAIFEGFKAYRQKDGHIASFRPDANARRFNASGRRLSMPELPVERFVLASDVLIRKEQDWVPPELGESLY